MKGFITTKRIIESSVLLMAIICVFAVSIMSKTDEESTLIIDVTPSSTAGIIAEANTVKVSAVQEVSRSTETAGVDIVASEEVIIEEVIEEDPILAEWEDKLIAQVNEYLSIRTETDENAEVVGKLKRGDVATVLDVFDGWYEIESGNAIGYVSAEYCLTGLEAYEYAIEVCDTYATTGVAGLRIRQQASTDSKILKVVPQGTKLTVLNNDEYEEVDGWVVVSYDGIEGYVVADYVDVDMVTGEALTLEEEEAIRLAAEEEARKAKEAAEAKAAANQVIIDSADDLTLIAAIIQIEAGHEPYEGQVGVANVVLNRVSSPSYPNTVGEVIFAKGQFASSKMGKVIGNGVSSTCLQAASDAMAGVNTVGGACHFRRAGNTEGLIIGHHVFY
ncbi:MAG: SH3 domain-containing protein [Pseudobutyrivibrio sp.]|nr:SH3 domain-containing protein [Pseudobutyrivibrio sp.]